MFVKFEAWLHGNEIDRYKIIVLEREIEVVVCNGWLVKVMGGIVKFGAYQQLGFYLFF